MSREQSWLLKKKSIDFPYPPTPCSLCVSVSVHMCAHTCVHALVQSASSLLYKGLSFNRKFLLSCLLPLLTKTKISKIKRHPHHCTAGNNKPQPGDPAAPLPLLRALFQLHSHQSFPKHAARFGADQSLLFLLSCLHPTFTLNE